MAVKGYTEVGNQWMKGEFLDFKEATRHTKKSGKKKCPDCDDGWIRDCELCKTCKGSGEVHEVQHEIPILSHPPEYKCVTCGAMIPEDDYCKKCYPDQPKEEDVDKEFKFFEKHGYFHLNKPKEDDPTCGWCGDYPCNCKGKKLAKETGPEDKPRVYKYQDCPNCKNKISFYAGQCQFCGYFVNKERMDEIDRLNELNENKNILIRQANEELDRLRAELDRWKGEAHQYNKAFREELKIVDALRARVKELEAGR